MYTCDYSASSWPLNHLRWMVKNSDENIICRYGWPGALCLHRDWWLIIWPLVGMKVVQNMINNIMPKRSNEETICGLFKSSIFFDTLFVTHRGSHFFFNHMYKLCYRKFNLVSPPLHSVLIVTSACPSVVYRLASRSVRWSDCHDLPKKAESYTSMILLLENLSLSVRLLNFWRVDLNTFSPQMEGKEKTCAKTNWILILPGCL